VPDAGHDRLRQRVIGCACAVMVRLTRSSSTIRSMSWKYSSRMAGGLRALRRDETVDAGAEIVEDEILLGRGLAVIDLLGPLFQR
jgi:hypothetical protein